ncbi:MAG TPA: STAS domain-containing protein [Pirellulales bacterium]
MSSADSPTHLNIHQGERSLFVWFNRPALIDSAVVVEIGNQLFAAHDARPDFYLVVSFQGVQGVSSAMLGKLITLHRRAQRAGRRLALCEMEAVVHEMFSSSRLCDYFTIVSHRTHAEKLVHGWLNEPRTDVLPPG